MTEVIIQNAVSLEVEDGRTLCLQDCAFRYEGRWECRNYRLVWLKTDSIKVSSFPRGDLIRRCRTLVERAVAAGWFKAPMIWVPVELPVV
jgi:hypothetical protein